MLDREDIREINAANAAYERHIEEEKYYRLHRHEIEEDRRRKKMEKDWHFDPIVGGYYYGYERE